MALQDFNHIKSIITTLNIKRPARFAYTQSALDATGTEEVNALTGVYVVDDSSQINSIPEPDQVALDSLVMSIGLRTQAATASRMMLNHFFGRLSLNLVKLTEKLKMLVEDHLVNRYITPSGNIMEDVSLRYTADTITVVKHKSPLAASAPATASAAISMTAAVYDSNAGVMTGADKKILDDLNAQAVRKSYFDVAAPPPGSIMAYMPGYFGDGSNGSYVNLSLALSANWKVCDGSLCNDNESPIFNGAGRYLPNITDERFIKGSTIALAGVAGGNANNQVSLAETNLPAHSHTIAHTHTFSGTTAGQSVNHTHSFTLYGYTGNADDASHHNTTQVSALLTTNENATKATGNQSADHTHSVSGTTSASSAANSGSAGTGSAFSILPLYLTAAFIMRIK